MAIGKTITVLDSTGTTQTIETTPAAAEDLAHASGDKGIMALAVRKDTATALAGTDGDYAPLEVDSTGRLHVNVGNTNANGQATMAGSAPVAIASDQSGIPVTNAGTFATQALLKPSATANGTTSSRINAAASTNATSVKASAGQVYSVDVFNVAAYDVFLKFYNKASAPTVGTDTPIWTIPLKAGAGYSTRFPLGKAFSTGIAYAITKLQADSDTTVLVALDVTGTMDWI